MNVATAPASPDDASDWLAAVYAPWGGNATAMANDIDEAPVTTNQWRFRKRIPEKYWERIIVAAAARGHTLTHRNFIHPDFRVDGAVAAAAQ